MPRNSAGAARLPFTWDLSTWPPDVWPFEGEKARHVIRQHADELLRAGALTRPAHKIIIFGDGYTKWLRSKAARVLSAEI